MNESKLRQTAYLKHWKVCTCATSFSFSTEKWRISMILLIFCFFNDWISVCLLFWFRFKRKHMHKLNNRAGKFLFQFSSFTCDDRERKKEIKKIPIIKCVHFWQLWRTHMVMAAPIFLSYSALSICFFVFILLSIPTLRLFVHIPCICFVCICLLHTFRSLSINELILATILPKKFVLW